MDKHDTLMIASGSPDNRRQLRMALETRYNLLEATNVQQLCLLLKQNIDCIAAVVLDITEPDKLEWELLSREVLERVPVIAISDDQGSPEVLDLSFDQGAADVIPLNYQPHAMLRRIENIVDLYVHKQHLEALVEEQMNTLRHSNEAVVDALSSIIEYRSVESGQHILRIRHFTKILLEEVARSCPEYGLTDKSIAIISSASALHDIGKIAIPDAILMKPGKLTQEEREVMKTHSRTGCEILGSLHDVGDPEYQRYAHNICHYHHERWDGNGYPEGLSGDDIPICAQVVGLADVYDALTTKRVYKDAFSFDQAMNMILRGECGVFSPKLLECFKHVAGQYEALARAYADGMAPDKEKLDMTLPPPSWTETLDSMDWVRAKYYALIHYINGLLVEVDLDQGMLHLIYNPYPEFVGLQEVSSFEELGELFSSMASTAEGKAEMARYFREEVYSFREADMRRMTRHIRLSSDRSPEGEEGYELTLFRIVQADSARRTLAILLRKLEPEQLRSGDMGMRSNSTLRCRADGDITLIRLNDHIHKLAGYSREELKSEFNDQLIRQIIPEDREKVLETIRGSLLRGTTGEVEYRVRHKDGRQLWLRNSFFQHTSPTGEEYLDCFLSDITDSKREFDALKKKIDRYEIILAQTEHVLFEWDYIRDTVTFSDTWYKLMGRPVDTENFRRTLTEGTFFHPDDIPVLVDKLAAMENGSSYEMLETRLSAAGARYLWCRIRASAIRDDAGALTKVVGIIINIDAEKQAQRLLQDRAERDPLTKLLNKNAARKQAEEYLEQYPDGISCALLIIDLDDFKQVNDRYGHLFGDAVLTKVARQIERSFRGQDIVSRIGGDEFMVMMRGVSDRGLLESRCKRLLSGIQGPFRNKQTKLPISCSIGVALAPEDGTTYHELFMRADQALYQSKGKGKNCYTFYDHDSGTQAHPDLKPRATKPIDSDREPGMAEGNIVQYAFKKLYASRDVDRSIDEILALIGRKMNVSRVYIFENSEDDRVCSNTYEWCNEGIQPQIHLLQDVSYETDIPGYTDNFDEDGIFYCPDVTLLTKQVYDILEPQGIKSLLQCAIREDGRFRGYVGFDECVEQRLWTREELELLTFLSEALSMFLLRMRRKERERRQQDVLQSILDDQPAWIYVADPGSFRLRYINAKLRQLLPEADLKEPCYKVLKGRNGPCDRCPLRQIGERTAFTTLEQDDAAGCMLLREVTRIRWEDGDTCLVADRKIPGSMEIISPSEGK